MRNQDNPSVILINSNMTPTIRINDPMGLVGRLTSDISALQVQLQQMILPFNSDNKDQNNYYQSALLTYHTFFSDELAFNENKVSDADAKDYVDSQDKWWIPKDAGSPNIDNITRPNLLKQAQANLDRTKLETILKVKERAKLRELIKQLQAVSIKIVSANDKENWYAIPYSYTSAFPDLTSSCHYSYFPALVALSGVLSTTCLDPHDIDHKFDVNVDKEPVYTPPGAALAHSLAEQRHPLSKLLFPTNDDESNFDSQYQKDFDFSQKITQDDLEKHDSGNGLFNLMTHINTFNHYRKYIPNDQTLELFSASISGLILVLKKYAPQSKVKVLNVIKSWVKVTGIRTFSELQLAEGKLVSAKHDVLGYRYEDVNTYIEEHTEAYKEPSINTDAKAINLYYDDPSNGGSTKRTILRQFDAQSVYKNSGADIETFELTTFASETEFRTETITKIRQPLFSLSKAIHNTTLKTLQVTNKMVVPFLVSGT